MIKSLVQGKRVAIVGSRDFPNMGLVEEFVSSIEIDCSCIVSGGARGVDSVAVAKAEKDGYTSTEVYPADWDKYGKAAGFRRNQDIVDNSDVIVAFWDGKSRGTNHTVKLAYAAKKPVLLFVIQGKDNV